MRWSSLEFMEVNESTGSVKYSRSSPQRTQPAVHSLQFPVLFVSRAELRLVQKTVPHSLLRLPLSLTRCYNLTKLLSCQHHGGNANKLMGEMRAKRKHSQSPTFLISLDHLREPKTFTARLRFHPRCLRLNN